MACVKRQPSAKAVEAASAGAPVESVLSHVADRLATIRRERRLSLDQLARRAEVSKGMLVLIEQRKANPSIAVLVKIANALRASVAELVDVGGESPARIVPADRHRKLWTGPRGGSATLLVGSNGPDMLELWHWVLRPGERYDAPAHTLGTRELIHVTAGTLAVEVSGVTHRIDAGASLVALTDRTHAYACVGKKATTFTMVVGEWHSGRGD
jgi:transcriptional regulator with XRE-family HTH domain